MFKVGDKVRVVSAAYYDRFQNGYVGIITRQSKLGENGLLVDEEGWYHARQLAHYTGLMIGDVVAIKDGRLGIVCVIKDDRLGIVSVYNGECVRLYIGDGHFATFSEHEVECLGALCC